MTPPGRTLTDNVGILGFTGYTIISLLFVSIITSLVAFFELAVLHRQHFARHTMALGIVFPLSVSLVGVFIAARALSEWSVEPMEPQMGYGLIGFIHLTALLGIIVTCIGAAVHIAAIRASNRQLPSPIPK